MPNSEICEPSHFLCVVRTIFIILCLCILIGYRPVFLLLHANATSQGGKIKGVVYKYDKKRFLIKLKSGTNLIVDMDKNNVLLNKENDGVGGIRFGSNLLLCTMWNLRGIDLTLSEKFDEQKPVIINNTVKLRDPFDRCGEFSFPLN